MKPERRAVLKAGLAGSLALAFAGAMKPAAAEGPPRSPARATVLDAADREVLAAIVPAMLAGTRATARVDEVVSDVDAAVAGLPLHLQREVRQLFALLGFAPARWLLCGIRAPWAQATTDEVAAFLQRWRTSRFALQQQAYLALHELTMAAWYARPESWLDIGYPGPPRLAA